MKKLLSLLLAMLLLVSLAACSGQSAKNIEGTLPEIMDKILENVEVDDEFREYVLGRLMFTELDSENAEYFLGSADYSFKEGYAAEPMVSSQAFSLVLVRTETAADAEKLKEDVVKTVNPAKWICVWVEEDQVKSTAVGDLMLLVMVPDNPEQYIEVFEGLAK